jgi:endonuclease/exonuclease/phosphatase family metal-dependent hydrolase
MRLLVYNIAYGTGAPEAFHHQLLTIHRYLRTPRTHLDRIINFIDESEADIIGLLEIDTGSYRTNYLNQVEVVASHLKHYYHTSTKYGQRSMGRRLPIFKNQANAILTKEELPECQLHYLPVGFKKLIIEVCFKGVKIYLVHLALQRRIRRKQLEHLVKLVRKEKDTPVIIAGDFNTFKGNGEVKILQHELSLINANNSNTPTYPSWNPRKQLDFIFCSKQININKFEVPEIKYSDHLPLIMDFSV